MSKHRKRKRRSLIDLRVVPSERAQDILAPTSKPTILAIAYGPEKLQEQEIKQPEEIRPLIGKSPVLWINVEGVGDPQLIHKIGDIFLLHELALEDVMHINQRPKVEPYGDQLFIVLRTATVENDTLASEQICIFLGKGFIITFEEKQGSKLFNAVRDRLRKSSGLIRTEQADYLLYAIVDAVVDGYFPVVEAVGDALESLEDEIIEQATSSTPAHIHDLKRDVLRVRRAIWPARDAVNILTREDTSDLLGSKTRVYMRDCYDHAMRVIDLVETQREMCSDLMDLYLSSVSNRMNEVIKILTIVTLLFMPPTLVAGIYGMNFKIPEYKWNFGYAYSLTLMGLTSVFVWLWARHRGWLGDDAKPNEVKK